MSRKLEIENAKTGDNQSFDTNSKESLPADCQPMVLEGKGIEVVIMDDKSGRSGETPTTVATLDIGDIISTGTNKGWIYCETPDKQPFLVAPQDGPGLPWRQALDFAASQQARLPTRAEFDAMYANRDHGAFKQTFNRLGLHPSDWYWSVVEDGFGAWCQSVSTDFQYYYHTPHPELVVRCVRSSKPGIS